MERKPFHRNARASWLLVTMLPEVAREQNVSFQMKQLFVVHFANVPSLRAQFGTEMPFNAVHGSQDRDDASRELALLFPTFKFSDEVPEASLGKSSRQFWPLLNLQGFFWVGGR